MAPVQRWLLMKRRADVFDRTTASAAERQVLGAPPSALVLIWALT